MARGMKPGWCCCCRQPDRLACGGPPQSRNYCKRCVHCRYVFSSFGSPCYPRTGRDPAGWFNPEFQTRGLFSIGITIISSPENCAANFPRSRVAANAAAYFGTRLCSMRRLRSGVVPRPSSRMVPLSMQRPFLRKGLQDFRGGQEIEMDSKGCSANDLTGRKAAWLLWY